MMNVYILLDRSGSMSTLWTEAIGSINGYVAKLPKSTKVHLAAFDSISHDVVRDVKAKDWVDVKVSELEPRGSTPLYDSCGKVMALAEEAGAKKTMLVVMTDGYENCSREYRQDAIKAKVKSWEDRKWEVVFLGANFDSVDLVSGSVGVVQSKTINYASGNMLRGMEALAASTTAYSVTGASVNFSPELKAELSSKTIVSTGTV